MYFGACILLIPAAIFMFFGLYNKAGLTLAIGGACLIGSIMLFLVTNKFYEQPNLVFPWEAEEQIFADSGKRQQMEKPQQDTTRFRLNAGEFNVVIHDFTAVQTHQEADTLFIDADPGIEFDRQRMELKSSELNNLEIETCFETGIIISADGPHCDLYEWKHNYSPYKRLLKNQGGCYLGPHYVKEEYKKYTIQATVEEPKAYVDKHCGVQYIQAINDIREVGQAPSYITIMRVFFRLSGTNNTGVKRSKILCFRIFSGC